MKTALTIYLGNDSAFAAVEVNGQIDLLALGESEAGLPIKETLDTENLFYKEAELHDEDLIHLEQSLANLFSRIIARCIRVVDIYPDEVLLVVSGDSSGLDVYYAASRRAQIINMTVIEENRSLAALASYGPKGISSDYAPAIGGLFWIRHGDSLTGSLPIVTREDLGAEEKVVKKPRVAPSAPSVISLGDRSVFDLQINRNRKKRFNLSWVIAVLILCTGVASVYYFAFPGSQESSTKLEGAVVPVTSVPVTSVPVTSVPVTSVPVTSVPVTSVPVTSVPVTSVPVTSDDGEVIEVETVELGVVTLNENGLLLLAGTANQLLLSFESPQEAVMSSLIGILGEPDEQLVTGNETCDSNVLQVFKFEDLEVVFKSYDMGPIFSQWFVSGEDASKTGLWTLDRIGLGSSIAELKKLPKGLVVIEEVFPGTNDPAGKFQIDPFSLGMLINGLTSNTNDQGKILQMWAGEGCQRFSED